MTLVSVAFGVSADGRPVAEALIANPAEGESLLAQARAAGSKLAWAHSAADLSPLGFRSSWGFRRLEGPTGGGPARGAGPDSARGQDVVPLAAEDDTAGLWAQAFSGQWGHKTPGQWPPDRPAGSTALALRRDGRTVGVCRVFPASGLIDGPGLIGADPDAVGYSTLLVAALAAVHTPSVAVESWGDGQDRLEACERLGLATAEYVPGWEFDLDS